MTITPIKRALLSVSDKTGLLEFAKEMVSLGVEIISTGGTAQLLQTENVPHQPVEAVTGLAEMLDGRVKTLHPKVHGGILGKRDAHADEAKQHGIEWIDLVVVNFYPFCKMVTDVNVPWEKAIEYIDIGGPTMVRAAAKNHAWVGVVTEPSDYPAIIAALKNKNGLDDILRRQLAAKAFAQTATFDAAVARYFAAKLYQGEQPVLNLQVSRPIELRYGENPHQKAFAYTLNEATPGVLAAEIKQGKPLSYNNILDADAAWACISEFTVPACVIVKHANPCGAATAATIEEAYQVAYAADALSAFGGVVALNKPCSKKIAEAISNIFMEIVLAPDFSNDALAVFATKPNLRVLKMSAQDKPHWEMKFITGGVLVQEKDPQVIHEQDLKVVTKRTPSMSNLTDMAFAWQVLKYIKSNAILLAKNSATVGIGAGQVSRVDAVDIALRKAGQHIEDTILASDAFFPFRDSIDKLAGSGVSAIIQPGGSVRDEEVIAACDEHDIAMVFTGKRCFRH